TLKIYQIPKTASVILMGCLETGNFVDYLPYLYIYLRHINRAEQQCACARVYRARILLSSNLMKCAIQAILCSMTQTSIFQFVKKVDKLNKFA
ncbi:hypothetical protein L9F63_008044, partial [Diploptera punctata]